MDPYLQYMYSYPHKTAYGPLAGVSLLDHAGALAGDDLSLYLHIPFCETKCGYCNLFSVTGQGEEAVERYLDAVERLNEIAAAAGYNMIEMALKWLLASKAVTSVIVGFSRLEQLQQNLDLVERENAQPLPMAQIDAVWTALMGSRFSYHQ